MRARPALLVAASAVLGLGALSGCAVSAPVPTTAPPSSPPPTIDPGVEVVPTAAPQLRPGGTAEQNKLYWDAAIQDYSGRFGLGSTQTMIDQLANWGFDPAATEITYDSTAIGTGVDSIEVSVRFGDECLLATVRNGRYTTALMPVLGTGTCLVGETRPVG